MRVKYLAPSAFSIIALTLSCVITILMLTHANLRNYPHIITLAGQLFILTLLLDGLDGIIARLLHAESNFGCFLDTYMDFITYAILPAIMFLQLFGHNILNYLLFIYIIVMGACRLSKFHTNRIKIGSGAFMGLPITLNALWIIITSFLLYGNSVLKGFFNVHYNIIYPVFIAFVIIFCLLQVLNIKYPKPTGNPFIIILAIIFTAVIFTSYIAIKTYLAILMLLYVLYFVLSGIVVTLRAK